MNRNAKYHHTPVLLNEVVDLLDVSEGDLVVDGTLGGGGYSKELLGLVGKNGKVLSIDLDEAALENFRLLIAGSSLKDRSVLVHGNFADIDKIVLKNNFLPINKVVVDIGLSSYQLDNSGRGITFQNDELLDMRFDVSSKSPDARFILNHYDLGQLVKIFKDYGEEKWSLQIAKNVVRKRSEKQLETTFELVEIIKEALPKPVKHLFASSARRIFQALRIAVNHELDNLENFLPKAFELLVPGGRIAVVTFHSLEDRIVKQYFASLTKGCVCPVDFPQCVCGKLPQGELVNRKPVIASEEEFKSNSRSHSAKLRVIKKL